MSTPKKDHVIWVKGQLLDEQTKKELTALHDALERSKNYDRMLSSTPTPRIVLCSICRDPNKPLTDGEYQAEEIQRTPDGDAHADCYYAKLGEEVEAHPIHHPGLRRG